MGGKAYSKEISIIRRGGYDTVYTPSLSYANTYMPASWANITNPGNEENGFFAYAGFVTSKENINGNTLFC